MKIVVIISLLLFFDTVFFLSLQVQWRKKKLNDAESLVALGNNQAQYKKMLDPIDDDD